MKKADNSFVLGDQETIQTTLMARNGENHKNSLCKHKE